MEIGGNGSISRDWTEGHTVEFATPSPCPCFLHCPRVLTSSWLNCALVMYVFQSREGSCQSSHCQSHRWNIWSRKITEAVKALVRHYRQVGKGWGLHPLLALRDTENHFSLWYSASSSSTPQCHRVPRSSPAEDTCSCPSMGHGGGSRAQGGALNAQRC